MTLAPSPRRVLLLIHVTASIGWIGTVIAYLTLALAAEVGDALTRRAAWIGMEITGWYAIVPLALTSLITGVIMAAGTRWGLVRHYWVLLSLILTALSTVILILHMPTVSTAADVARSGNPAEIEQLGSDLMHPGVGLLILIGVAVLNTSKPRGLTAYGRRRRRPVRQS